MIYGGGGVIIVCYLSQDLQHTRTPVTLLLGCIRILFFYLVYFWGVLHVNIGSGHYVYTTRPCVCVCVVYLSYTLIYMYRRNRHAISNRKGH